MHFILGIKEATSLANRLNGLENLDANLLASIRSAQATLWVGTEIWDELPAEFQAHAIAVQNSFKSASTQTKHKSCSLAYLYWHLQNSNHLLQSVLESDPKGKLLFNEQGEVLFGNQVAGKLLKLAWPNSIRLSDFQAIEKTGVQNLDLRLSNNFSGTLTLSPRPEIQLGAKCQKIHSGNDAFYILDIEEKSKASEFPLSSKNLLNEHLLAKSLGAYVILNDNGKVLIASDEVEKIVGTPAKNLIGKHCIDYQHPSDHKVFKQSLSRLRENPKDSIVLKYRVKHAEGYYRWVRTTISNLIQQPEIGGFLMMVQDIDAQERELLNSNQRFKWATKASKDIIWDWNFKAGTITWGENLMDMLGWDAADLDTTDKWLSKIPVEDHQPIDQSLNTAFEDGSEIWICRYRFQKSDGSLAQILDRGYIERDGNGAAIRLIGAMHDYSEQHRYEHQLRNERRKFQQLFERSLIGAAMLNLEDLSWQDCNQSLLNILGFKREEFLNLKWKDTIPREELELNTSKIEQLHQEQTINAYQTNWLRKDLVTTHVVVSGFKTSGEEGQEIAWFHILDLGPIEESNKALVEAESRFRQYIEKASDIFLTLSDDGVLEYVSPNIQSLLGFRSQELLSAKIEELIHPADHIYAQFAFKKAYLQPGETFRAVFRMRTKNQDWLWVEGNGSFQSKGPELKAFINLRDIQKEHEIEAELRKLSLVANRTSNGVLIVDSSHRVEWLNQSFSQMSGYSLEEVKGKTMEELLHGQNSISTKDPRLKDLLDEGKPFRFENINYKKDGTEYWVESIVTPIFDDHGKLVNYISIEMDITERKMEELDFQQNLQLISEQNERLRSFAHIVSHNFRSHGSNIHQLIHELNVTTDQILKDELHSYLELSSNGLMQALDELAGLLEVESASDLPTEELNVQAYCDRVRQILSRPTMKAKAELEFNIPKGFTMNFYPAYFESVLFNLVSNALRYHDPHKDPWVKVWVEEDQKSKYLMVADNGLGIDLEKHGDEVFKFKRSFHDHPESSGIGLYLVRNQVESLGGEISVQSVVGQGTTFTVSLPK